jgi:hypothetical protein
MTKVISTGSIGRWTVLQHFLFFKTTRTTTISPAIASFLLPIPRGPVGLFTPHYIQHANKPFVLDSIARSITSIRLIVNMSTSTGRATRSSRRTSTKRLSTTKDDDADETKTKKSKSTTSSKDIKTKKKNVKNEPSLFKPATGGDEPWYTVFTKGDEQYTEYMKTEWGVEKVRINIAVPLLISTSLSTVYSSCLHIFPALLREVTKSCLKNCRWKELKQDCPG